MAKDESVMPILKWAGGKRQLVDTIVRLLPRDLPQRTYCEPFVGGGALLFALQPRRAAVNDSNEELINLYRVVRDAPEALIESLRRHENSAEYFYAMRALDREPGLGALSEVERASRIVYLNKTCYNGLYRVNGAGCFNTPFGRYRNPNIVNEPVLRAVSEYLRSADIRLTNEDYERVLEELPADSFVYLDPPYHPVSESSSFTGYVRGGWTAADQERLKRACDRLDERGIRFLLSNSSAPLIRELYADYDIRVVRATRAVNSVAAKRGAVDELLIRNYD